MHLLLIATSVAALGRNKSNGFRLMLVRHLRRHSDRVEQVDVSRRLRRHLGGDGSAGRVFAGDSDRAARHREIRTAVGVLAHVCGGFQ